MRLVCSLLMILATSGARADTRLPATATPAACAPLAALDAALRAAKPTVVAVRSQAATLDRLARATSSDACRVQLFERYWRFYEEAQAALAARIEPRDEAARAPLLRAMAPLGWSYQDSEAGGYVRDGSDWLLRHAGGRLPAPYRAWLALRLRDIAEGFSEDAGLRIGWTQLRERIRRWEDFEQRFPRFERSDEVHAGLHLYLVTLLTGMDNTPAFTGGDDALDPELRRELEAYLADEHARNRPLVRAYYDLVQRNQFRRPPDLDELLAAQQLDDVHGEPPRY
jgi:hypothetical protein